MAYNKNVSTAQNNVVVVSGSQIAISGSLIGTNISGTIGQFTNITSSFTGSGIGLYNLTASGISNFVQDVRAQFTAGNNITIVSGVISAQTGSGTGFPGGLDKYVQFNSGSTFSGSANLIYNYTTNILSGTTAQFTAVTSSFAGDGSNLINISRKLINYINNGPAEEYTSSYLEIDSSNTVFPTSSIWYTDITKTKKIYEEFYQRSGSGTQINPNPITYKLYKSDGVTVLIQATNTITYTSFGASNISRSISSSY